MNIKAKTYERVGQSIVNALMSLEDIPAHNIHAALFYISDEDLKKVLTNYIKQ